MNGLSLQNYTFPTVMLDGFFNNPDRVKQWALSHEFYHNHDAKWPGYRTIDFAESEDPEHIRFTQSVGRKFLSLWWPTAYIDPNNDAITFAINGNLLFQRIPNDEYGHLDVGWVHRDWPAMYTIMVYLNDEPSFDSGTSLYAVKERPADILDNYDGGQDEKIAMYEKIKWNPDVPITVEEHNRGLEHFNSRFKKSASIGSEYNRMIGFESGHYFHSASNLKTNSGEDRLFMIYFINEIQTPANPMGRMKTVSPWV